MQVPSSKLWSSELAAASSGPLRSLELAAASSELGACVATSFGARSLVAASSELRACLLRAQGLLQQAPSSKLRSLRCSKLSSSELACCEFEACCSKLWSSELACCKLGARSLRCSKLRSSKLATASSEQQAPELVLQQAPELGACLLRAPTWSLLQQAPELGACLL